MMRSFKRLLLISISMAMLSASFTTLSAESRSDKSNIKSEQSFVDLTNNVIVYKNAVYTHGTLYIKAATLSSSNNESGLVTAQGAPLEIQFTDENGSTTNIKANQLNYHQISGKLEADGNITIVQDSGEDTLTLTGNALTANPRIQTGFSFILQGSPTEFIIQSPQQLPVEATAQELRSNGKDKLTELVGNVQLKQGTATMSSAFLLYDGTNKTIRAGQSSDGSTQVVSEFYWDNETPEPKSEQESDSTDDSAEPTQQPNLQE